MTFWTEDRIAFLRDNADKLSASAIADHLGCTRNAVIGKVNRLGASLAKGREPVETPPPPAPKPKPVPLVEIERGKYKATRPGYFQARCAACGERTDELAWGARAEKAASLILRGLGWRFQGKAASTIWTCDACDGISIPKPEPRQIVVRKPDPAPPPIVVSEPKTLVEMGNHCLWPIGDPQDEGFRYCGAPRSNFRYCAGHAALSRGGGTPSERQAHKPVKRMFCR